MNNTQSLWGEYSGARPGADRKRSLIFVLSMAICLMSLRTTALGQTCFLQCQQTLSQCLQAAQGDPLAEARCQDNYDKCGEECM
jgi:hypothetical protein